MADLSDITIGIKVEDGDVIRGIKTFERMKRQVADLTLSERKGEISRKAYNRSLQQMAQQLGKVTGNLNNAKSSIQKYAFAVKDATDEQLKFQSVSGKGMRRFELIAQQAGYQFGDLAVQIQSGTNAAVALGQQGSQLLGFFGPYGALAGAGLAITTGIVAPFLNAKEEVKGLQEELKKLEDFINSVGQATTIEGLKSRELAEAIEKLAQAEAGLKAVRSGQLRGPSAPEGANIPTGGGGVDTQQVLNDQIAAQEELVAEAEKELRAVERKVRQQEVYNALKGSEILEAENLREVEEKGIRDRAKADQDYQERLARTRRGIGQLLQEQRQEEVAEAKEYEDRLARIRRIMGDIEQERRKEAAERKRIAESTENTDKLRHEMELRRAELLEDFYERKRERAREADQEALRAQELLAKATESAISNQLSQQESLQVEIAEVGAAIEAVKNGQDASVASFIAGELAKAEAAYEVAKALAIQGNNLIALAEAALTFVDVEESLGKLKELRTELSTLEDGKRSGKSTTESNLERLEKQLDLQKELRNKTLVEQQLIKSLGKEYKDLSASTLEKLRKRIIEQEKYNKVVAQQEEIANTIAGGFGDAFMSIVDGTKSAKEAFSDMARHIIARLFEILVIEQMVQSIAGGIKMAFGGASGTAVASASVPSVESMDGGGYTGSGSRSGGLDGRGGFMAMLHPRETIIDHTKPNQAMSQQPVVIHQNFNFAANGDDSVKKIIAQEAPKIARMTQQQILDQRRRGGQMKAAFS